MTLLLAGNWQATGVVVGTGSAIDIELGWVPDRVEIYNATDGDKVHVAFPGRIGRRMVFTSGGTTEILPGDVLRGVTSLVEARITGVVLTSGTWAAGTAAGSFFFSAEDETGTFSSEDVRLFRELTELSANAATVVAQVEDTYDVDTEVAAATGNNGVLSFVGSGGTSPTRKGFTIGSTVSESAKVLRWYAWRIV